MAVGEGYITIARDKFGRWIVLQGGGGDSSFWVILTGKKAVLFDPGVPPFGSRWRGEYSGVQAEEQPYGKMRPKQGGLFFVAGEVDAIHDVNRANVNAHLSNMVVRVWPGPAFEESSDVPPSELVSSHYQEASSLEGDTIFSYWCDFNLPREDGPGIKRYFLRTAVGNDEPI